MHSTSNPARPKSSTTSASSRSPSLQRECACSSQRRPPPTTLLPCELLMHRMVAYASPDWGGQWVSNRKRPGNPHSPVHLPCQLGRVFGREATSTEDWDEGHEAQQRDGAAGHRLGIHTARARGAAAKGREATPAAARAHPPVDPTRAADRTLERGHRLSR